MLFAICFHFLQSIRIDKLVDIKVSGSHVAGQVTFDRNGIKSIILLYFLGYKANTNNKNNILQFFCHIFASRIIRAAIKLSIFTFPLCQYPAAPWTIAICNSPVTAKRISLNICYMTSFYNSILCIIIKQY